MTATAVGLFRESFFCRAARPVILFCRWILFTGRSVVIGRAKLLAALPAPGSATSGSYGEGTRSLQTASKDIVTRGIFEGPALAPRTLLCVCRHLL